MHLPSVCIFSPELRQRLSNINVNLTSTFRSDSDFHIPLFYTVKRDAPCGSCLPNFTKFAKRKKQLIIAWFVSHCITHSRREEYFDRLSKYISTGKFGRCGNDSICSRKKHYKTTNCVKDTDVLKNYKFYFSAENSICKDYVTG